MKKVKIIALTLTLALLLMATLVACSTDTNSTTPTTEPTTEPSIPSTFGEVPSPEELLTVYRTEVETRCERDEYFTREEREFIEDKGYNVLGNVIQEYSELYGELYEMYFPVPFVKGTEVAILYTNEYGYLNCEEMENYSWSSWRPYDTWADVHHPLLEENEQVIVRDAEYAAIYQPSTGSVSFWQFGEIYAEFTVPEGAVYTGQSHLEGYLFRDGTDVYAGDIDMEVLPIAHNVQLVILADYYAGSDDWSQPLFLMKDGTLKVYCSWYGEYNAPADDPCHLKDVSYEGGYDAAP